MEGLCPSFGHVRKIIQTQRTLALDARSASDVCSSNRHPLEVVFSKKETEKHSIPKRPKERWRGQIGTCEWSFLAIMNSEE